MPCFPALPAARIAAVPHRQRPIFHRAGAEEYKRIAGNVRPNIYDFSANITFSAMCFPMANDAVAAGEGALQTCNMPGLSLK